jgi:hypothetical protein
MRDDERSFLPPSAADLYRAAYQVGQVRLAGVETRSGRKVFRLAFDWRGASYTLLFDAGRSVPISSVARSPQGHDNRFWVTRIRYAAYSQVQPGAVLEGHLRLPSAAAAAKTIREPALVIPQPAQGGSAAVLAREIAKRFRGSFPETALPGRASYAIVQRFPRGDLVAVARIPTPGVRRGDCFVTVEVAHPGGEATTNGIGCGGSMGSSGTRDGKTATLFGAARTARRVAIRFTDGPTVRASLRSGIFLATFPFELYSHPFSVVLTERDGTVSSHAWPVATGQPPTPIPD